MCFCNHRVLGDFKNGEIACDEVDAGIIAGSYNKMESYLENSNGGIKFYTISLSQ